MDDKDKQNTPSPGTPSPVEFENDIAVQPEYKHGIGLAVVIAPVTLVFFLVLLDASIVSTAIPAITSDFNSLLDVGWYGGAYQLASSAVQPLSGKLYTYFHTKWTFLAFFFIFEVGSAICGAAQSSAMFIVGRAIAGLGASGIINGALTVVAAVLPPHRQPLFMATNIAIGQLGVAFGPLIGGAFTEYVSWRWCFYINLPVGAVVCLILLPTPIPDPFGLKPAKRVTSSLLWKMDLLGFGLISPAAIMFFLALQYGGNVYAWNSSVVIGLFVGAAATLALFLVWEYRVGDEAMVPFSLLRERIIWSAGGSLFLFYGAIFCANFYLPIYFQAVKDESAFTSGLHLLPAIGGQIVFGLLSGVLIQTLGYYLPWVLGGGMFAAIGYGLLSLLDLSTPVGQWAGFEILYGVGCGAGSTAPFIAVQNLVPPAQIPIAMGIIVFLQNLGGAVFLLAAQTIFSNTLRKEIVNNAPGVSADQIILAGARSVRKIVSGEQLLEVLKAYSTAVRGVMYLGIGLSVATLCVGCWMGWKDIRVIEKNDEQSDKSATCTRSA